MAVTSPIDLAPDDLAVGRSHHLGSGRYENLLCVGRDDDADAPVLTFTSPTTMAHAELGAPALGLPQNDDRRPARVAQDA